MKFLVQEELRQFSRISGRVALVSSKTLAGVSELREMIFGRGLVKPLAPLQPAKFMKISAFKRATQEEKTARDLEKKSSYRRKGLRRSDVEKEARYERQQRQFARGRVVRARS